jgi:4-alpha-glucanotransferase
MRLIFQLRYRTNSGQSLFVCGDHEMFGEDDPARAIPLHYLDADTWQAVLILPRNTAPDAKITYHYILRQADGSFVHDWGLDRVVNPAEFVHEEVVLRDAWNPPGQIENAFYTEPFREVLLKANETEFHPELPGAASHTFKVKSPLLGKGQTLCLLGDGPALRDWNPTAPLLLRRKPGEDFLSVRLDLTGAPLPLAYKYGVYDLEARRFVAFEEGANRVLQDALAPYKHTILNDGFARLPATTWKGAGVAIPVFSLRSERSLGVGEFTDLKRLADWCKRAGLKLIQILPVNDTTATHTWQDSYPYSAISAFALHPLYLNLEQVAEAKHQALLAELEPERQRLNALDTLDYEAVMKAKLAFLRQIYPLQRQQTFRSREYRAFFGQNQHWLEPYAAFCCLRDQYGTPDFNHWPAHRRYQREEIAALAAPGTPAHDEIGFQYFLQFHLHLQLMEATQYAHAQGVILKGDIAIGVCRHGADTWQQPELYYLDVQAGAPPDAFAVKGQNWSFPTYNWPRMKQDGFAWWKRRFAQMNGCFDAFRIDHILGFFRIWSIPLDAVEGILGYFVPALPVRLEEFAARGIAFDRDRFVKPYITDAVLHQVLGGESEWVKNLFLKPDRPGHYCLKPEFATQRLIEAHFATWEDSDKNRWVKQGLFDLVSNVLLFEADGGQGRAFHFRFAIETTTTFRHLDAVTQGRLRDLYIDYFFRRQDGFWMREALEKLPALKRETNMLICGEDLGLVPGCVPEVMRQLGLLSLEIQRMPKAMGQEFFRPAQAPYLSVVTPSSHDMSTIRGWWEEDRKLSERFYRQELGQAGDAPATCEPWLNELIVRQHLDSPAMWSIFQLQDLLGLDGQLRRANAADERINVPANPRHYWRYRMHLTLEALLEQRAFNGKLAHLVHGAGR